MQTHWPARSAVCWRTKSWPRTWVTPEGSWYFPAIPSIGLSRRRSSSIVISSVALDRGGRFRKTPHTIPKPADTKDRHERAFLLSSWPLVLSPSYSGGSQVDVPGHLCAVQRSHADVHGDRRGHGVRLWRHRSGTARTL